MVCIMENVSGQELQQEEICLISYEIVIKYEYIFFSLAEICRNENVPCHGKCQQSRAATSIIKFDFSLI